jgi:DNA-binding IclR family transcriptional regulator
MAPTMAPFYGQNSQPPGDLVPDWLLGGNRKRRVLDALAKPQDAAGWKPAQLAETLKCGRTTVFEIVRVLRGLKILEEDAGHVRIASSAPLGRALIDLLDAVDNFMDQAIDRPPRTRDRTRADRPERAPK